MTLTDGATTDPSAEHLWLHFSRLADETGDDLVVIERGEGAYVWDTQGRRYLDGHRTGRRGKMGEPCQSARATARASPGQCAHLLHEGRR